MKPILFNTEMVKAILDGRKSMTRRVIKPRYKDDEYGFNVVTNKATNERWVEKYDEDGGEFDVPRYIHSKYQVGDILYIRETWMPFGKVFLYRADREIEDCPHCNSTDKWKPSIHMPKEAARIILKITNVKVERLQDINNKDIQAEGVAEFGCTSHRVNFQNLWDNLYAKSDNGIYAWDKNPWVWCYEFERVEEAAQ